MSFRYRLFDLLIDSQIEIPELRLVDEDGPADVGVMVKRGQQSGFRLAIDDVATFFVEAGRAISIDPVEVSDPKDVRLFLLGSAMGVLLHQRGVLPLHANAVVVNGRAVAFMGRSGVGKSTLAAWFNDRGHQVLADDVCAVRFLGDGSAEAVPGPPRLRLWQDALQASGRSVAEHSPSQSWIEADGGRKYDVSMTSSPPPEPCSLAAIYALEDGAELDCERLQGAEAVEILSANTYRGQLVSEIRDAAAHVDTCVRLAAAVPVYRMKRKWDPQRVDEIATEMFDLVTSHCQPTG